MEARVLAASMNSSQSHKILALNTTSNQMQQISEQMSIEDAMKFIIDLVHDSGRNINIQADSASGYFVVRVFDRAGELVRQIPTEEFLALVHKMSRDGVITLFSRYA